MMEGLALLEVLRVDQKSRPAKLATDHVLPVEDSIAW